MWRFELGRYVMECRYIERPRGTVTLSVLENDQQVHEEILQARADEDALMFVARVLARVSELQDVYRPRAMAGMQRELQRQAQEP